MDLYFTLLHLLILFFTSVGCEQLLQTLTSSVGGENYTNYKLSTQGRLRIEVDSLVGDADLFVSDSTLSPTFDDYVFQSSTCGTEEVVIPSHMKRPVGIAIYGNPNYELTEYKLSIFYLTQYDDADYAQLADLYNKMEDEEGGSDSYTDYATPSQFSSYGSDHEEKESVWSVIGTILSTILKIIFEILL